MAGERYEVFKRVGLSSVERLLEAIAAAVVALLIFPLYIWVFGVVAAAIAVILISYKRFKSRRQLVTALILSVLLGSTLNVAALLISGRSKYVVPVQGVFESFLIRTVDGPRGNFDLVPVGPFAAPKNWLLGVLASGNDYVTFMKAEGSGGAYVLYSAAELALARLDAPDGEKRRRILKIPRLDRNLLGSLHEGKIQINASPSGSRLVLTTDVGPGRPGLFGSALPGPPTLADWRRVAFRDELLLSLSEIEADDVITALESEFAETPTLDNLLRLVVFRLALVEQRYAQRDSKEYLFALATAGNLRRIRSLFDDEELADDLVTNPWFWSLEGHLPRYLTMLPKRGAQLSGKKVDIGGEWADKLLTSAAESLKNRAFAELNRENTDEQAQEEKAAVKKLIRDMKKPGATDRESATEFFARFKELFFEDPQKAIQFGDAYWVSIRKQANAPIVTPESIKWASAEPTKRASRTFLLYEAARERCLKPIFDAMARLTEYSDPDSKLRDLDIESACGEMRGVVELFPSGLHRRFITADIELRERSVPAFKLLADPDSLCPVRNESKRNQCILDSVVAHNDAPFAENLFRDMAGCEDTGCGGVELFEKRLPRYGKIYSGEEFAYVVYLFYALRDPNFTNLSPSVCRRVEGDFADVVQEINVLDRVTLLNVHLSALIRCRSPVVQNALELFRRYNLPVAYWQIFLPDLNRSSPS